MRLSLFSEGVKDVSREFKLRKRKKDLFISEAVASCLLDVFLQILPNIACSQIREMNIYAEQLLVFVFRRWKLE